MLIRNRRAVFALLGVMMVIACLQYRYMNLVFLKLGVGSVPIELSRRGVDVGRDENGVVNYVAFDNQKVTPQDIRYVQQIGTVRILSLSGSLVEDGVVEQLQELDSITSLILYGTATNDDDLEIIARMKSLRLVNLRNTRMTSDGITRLMRKRPEVEIQ